MYRFYHSKHVILRGVNSENYILNNQFVKEQIYKVTFVRTIFGGFGSRRKQYTERKLVGFSMDQMFSVVSDVGHYNQFVPFCKKSVILKENPPFLKAHLEIGFPPIMESYTSHVTLVKPRMVKAICVDGKLFDHLNTTWKFSPALKHNLNTCIIDFYISFEFRSVLHSRLSHLFFDALVRQMEEAFINEAKVRYGKESVPSRRLQFVTSRS